eukprot:TRINITY_DN3266_c1_g6_i1.p1 TRINITY_DN3266_c1_g6~~TRINITY_DN3266_c1_g6_i1.p1  ORF type:complete len:403 (-),score=98.55 TRINITY_DN3266_c1_g6_i1:291-1499(-)
MSIELNNPTEKNIYDTIPWKINESGERTIEGKVPGLLMDCAYSLDGKYLIFAGEDGYVFVIDMDVEKLFCTLKDHSSNVFGIAFSQDGQKFATSSHDKTIIIYDVKDFSVLDKITHYHGIFGICFSPCCNYIYFGDEEGYLIKKNIKTGDIMMQSKMHCDYTWRVRLSSNGRHILTAGFDYCAKLLDANDFSVIHEFSHDTYVLDVDFHPSKNIIATGDRLNKVHLWDMDDGSLLHVFDLNGEAWYLRFLTSNILVIMSGDGYITLYELDSFQPIQKIFCDCETFYFSFAISPDMKRLICGISKDEVIKVYPIVRFCNDQLLLKLIELSKSDATVLSNIIKMNIDNSVVRQLVSGGIDMSEDEYNIIIDRCWDLVDINEKNGGNMHEFVNKKGDELSDNDDD